MDGWWSGQLVAALSSCGQMGRAGGSCTQFMWTDGEWAGGSCTQSMWTDGGVGRW